MSFGVGLRLCPSPLGAHLHNGNRVPAPSRLGILQHHADTRLIFTEASAYSCSSWEGASTEAMKFRIRKFVQGKEPGFTTGTAVS